MWLRRALGPKAVFQKPVHLVKAVSHNLALKPKAMSLSLKDKKVIPAWAVDITLCHFDSRTIHCRHVHANRQCLTNQSSRLRQCVWRSDQEPGSVFEGQIKSQALFHVEPPKSKAMYMERGLSGEASFHKPVLKSQAMCLKARSRTKQCLQSGPSSPKQCLSKTVWGARQCIQSSPPRCRPRFTNQSSRIRQCCTTRLSKSLLPCVCVSVWYGIIR
jgi:hypothetical protein